MTPTWVPPATSSWKSLTGMCNSTGPSPGVVRAPSSGWICQAAGLSRNSQNRSPEAWAVANIVAVSTPSARSGGPRVWASPTTVTSSPTLIRPARVSHPASTVSAVMNTPTEALIVPV